MATDVPNTVIATMTRGGYHSTLETLPFHPVYDPATTRTASPETGLIGIYLTPSPPGSLSPTRGGRRLQGVVEGYDLPLRRDPYQHHREQGAVATGHRARRRIEHGVHVHEREIGLE